jgi:hypothetical protein
MVMYCPRREDEVLDGRVTLVGDDVQREKVAIKAHGGKIRGCWELCMSVRLESVVLVTVCLAAAAGVLKKSDTAVWKPSL